MTKLYNFAVSILRIVVLSPFTVLRCVGWLLNEAGQRSFWWVADHLPQRRIAPKDQAELDAYLADRRQRFRAAMAEFDRQNPPGQPLDPDDPSKDYTLEQFQQDFPLDSPTHWTGEAIARHRDLSLLDDQES